MLQRKISQKIEDFYKNKPHKALMIIGARQVGKSYIINEFAKSHYKGVIRIDFIENPDYVSIFAKAEGAEEILLRMSALFGDQMIPGNTIIIFDEAQECKELVTQIKYLVQDGTYDYILSGSLLGTIFKDIVSAPVGYMDIMDMYPLDFEEFAWANGVGKNVIDSLRNAFKQKKPVDAFIHERMMSLFELYLIVGGMPAAVSTYLATKNLRKVVDEQNSIIKLYKHDVSKYDEQSRLYLNDIFDLIPSELNSKNKRFILKNLSEKVRFDKYYDSFLWLKNAGVALPANVVDELKVPLLLSKSQNLFKLFSNDVGLLAAQYGGDIQLKILQHETTMNFGSIYENVAAQELTAHGYPLYYYNSKKFGEIDFIIEEEGKVLPIEIKSGKDYYRHNAMDNVLKLPEYALDEGYVFCNGNIESHDKITYFPIYMLMCISKKELPHDVLFNSDFSDLNDKI
ncbi:ATP-binding protein [Treponema rectale]|uniref:ATP-binding protein n=1 Tax=Treponema rectale TaxID=744512 RepID=A0A7M1XIW9_9SPIR|nr:ATP-binding protein [Treponema rectale]